MNDNRDPQELGTFLLSVGTLCLTSDSQNVPIKVIQTNTITETISNNKTPQITQTDVTAVVTDLKSKDYADIIVRVITKFSGGGVIIASALSNPDVLNFINNLTRLSFDKINVLDLVAGFVVGGLVFVFAESPVITYIKNKLK